MSNSDLFCSDSDTEEKSAMAKSKKDCSEWVEDLDDSDKDPEFEKGSYTRKRKRYLSDEEEEEVVREHSCKRMAVDQQPSYSRWNVEGDCGDDAELDGSESSEDDSEHVRHVEGDKSDISDYEALKERCLRVLNAAQMKASGLRKQNLVRKLDEVSKTKTPDELQAGYMAEIDRLRGKISSLKFQMNNEVAKNKAFWRVSTRNLSQLPKEGWHRLTSCPMVYCAAQVINLPQHLAQLHDITDNDAHKVLFKEWKQQKLETPKTQRHKRRCCICDKNLKRIDVHLVSTHGLNRGSARFRDFLQRSPHVCREGKTEEPTKSKCLQLRTTEEYAFKQFLEAFQAHLESSSQLSPSSIETDVRLITDLIKHSFLDQKDENFDDQGLIRTFSTLGDPKSFLRRKGDTLSGSYCCKIIITCIKVLGLLRSRKTSERFHVHTELSQETENSLWNLLKRYQKKELERASSRELKESLMLSTEEISRLLTSPVVKAVLESAADSLEREELRPVTVTGYLSLRDALITSLLLRSLGRAQEFTEFTVGEWEARTTSQDGEERIVKVKKHKATLYGSADFVHNPIEERAMQAYMLYARPVVTKCKLQSCPVFVSSVSSDGHDECCTKMHISNVTAIIIKMATKAGVSSWALNTQMMQQSTILATWKKNPDPTFRQEMSQLASHSIDTAQCSYAIYDTGEQSQKVVKNLEQYRGDTVAEVKDKGLLPEEVSLLPEEALPPAVQTQEGAKVEHEGSQTIGEGGIFLSPLLPIEKMEETAATPIPSPAKSILSSVTSGTSVGTGASDVASVATGASDLSVVTSNEEKDVDDLSITDFYKMVVAEQQALGARTGEKMFRWKTLHQNLAEKHPYFRNHMWEQVRSRYKYVRTLMSKMK